MAVTDTGVFIGPLVGSALISVIVRVPDVTEKAPDCVIVSAPFTVTFLEPSAAPGLIVRVATAVPFGWTATGPVAPSPAPPTEIPAPKFAVVPAGGKLVFVAKIVIWTAAPCAPEGGVKVKLGVPVSVIGSELLDVSPVPEIVRLYTPLPPGATKLIERPTPPPVITPLTLMGAPPPWGERVTVAVGAGPPTAKPVAVTLTGVPGLADEGSTFIRVMFCAYMGMPPKEAKTRTSGAYAGIRWFASIDIRCFLNKVLPVSAASKMND